MMKKSALSLLNNGITKQLSTNPIYMMSTKSNSNNTFEKTTTGTFLILILFLFYVVALGTTLLVGEGNLTYSKEILRQGVIHPKQLVATVFESEDLAYGRYAGMRSTAAALRKQGVTVLFGIDATSSLGSNTVLQQKLFKHIQFNYPHHVTAKSEDLKPNRELLTGFFRQAIPLLEQNGLVRVLLNTNYPFGELKVAAGVNDGDAEEKVEVAAGVNDWMKGWNIEMCAKKAGLKLLTYNPFKFGDHILYKPTKGFGKDPSGEWQTGESLFYDLQVDWSNPENANIPQRLTGSALLEKLDKNAKMPKKRN